MKDFASFLAITQDFKDNHALNIVLLDYKSIFNRYKTKLPLDNDKLVRLGRQAVEVRNALNPQDVGYQISIRYRRQRCLSGMEAVRSTPCGICDIAIKVTPIECYFKRQQE